MTATNITKNTIDNAWDSLYLSEAYGAFNTIKLDITIKRLEEEVPTHVKLSILDYLRYQPYDAIIKDGKFILTTDNEIEVFDLELQIHDNYYICNGTENDLRCKKRRKIIKLKILILSFFFFLFLKRIYN